MFQLINNMKLPDAHPPPLGTLPISGNTVPGHRITLPKINRIFSRPMFWSKGFLPMKPKRYCQYGPYQVFLESINYQWFLEYLQYIFGVFLLMSCAKLGRRTSRPGWRPVVKTRRILRRPAWEVSHVSHRRAQRSAVNWQMRRGSIIDIPENVTRWKLTRMGDTNNNSLGCIYPGQPTMG